jgi:hypothetical protein
MSQQEFNIKQGSTRSAALLLTSFLVKTHKFTEKKASTMAWDIAKKAKMANSEFTGSDIMELTQKELKISVSDEKATTVTKRPVKELTPKQLAIAQDESLSKNQRMEALIKQTSNYTAISKALGVGYQRVKNVKKSMDRKGAATSAKA